MARSDTSPGSRNPGRPPLPSSERRNCRIHVTLDEETREALRARAERARERLGTYVARVVRERLDAFQPLDRPPPEGRVLLAVATDRLEAIASGLCEGMTPEDVETLRDALCTLQEALHTWSPRGTR